MTSRNRSVSASITSIGTGLLLNSSRNELLALLDFGDVDANADVAAVGGATLFDDDIAAGRQALLEPVGRQPMPREPLREPLLLAADGVGVLAAREAVAKDVFEAHAGDDLLGQAVGLGVVPVPQHETVVGIHQRDAFGHHLQGFDKAVMGGLRVLLGAFRPRARLGHGLFAPPLRGDVLVGRNPGAVRHRLPADPDDAAVDELDRGVAGLVGQGIGIAPDEISVRAHHRRGADLAAQIDDLAERDPGDDLSRAEDDTSR